MISVSPNLYIITFYYYYLASCCCYLASYTNVVFLYLLSSCLKMCIFNNAVCVLFMMIWLLFIHIQMRVSQFECELSNKYFSEFQFRIPIENVPNISRISQNPHCKTFHEWNYGMRQYECAVFFLL